jgi:uncharacterized protein with beta-barrel porin domain
MSQRRVQDVGAGHAGSACGALTPEAYSAIYNYAGDAGPGSQTFTQSESWRRALLGTAVVGALIFGWASRADAQTTLPPASGPCVLTDAATFTCMGDVSAGVALTNAAPDAFTTLNINSLTQNIAPAANVNGIEFTSDGDITINSDTGAFSIQTSGTASAGIYASSTGGNVAVYSSGDILNAGTVSNSDGIYAVSTTGNVTVTTNGSVSTRNSGDGIHAGSNGGGTVSVTTNGPVTGGMNAGDGIQVFANNGGTGIISVNGDVTAATRAIALTGDGASTGTVTIYSGTVSGGTVGVRLATHTATLNNYGTILAGTTAVSGGLGGDDTVNNYGTITGTVDLGSGNNAFYNFAGGVFNSGDTVDLGGGTLTNYSSLSPHGSGTIGTTAINTGNLVQKSDGVFAVDIDGASADSVTVSGTADLAGRVVPNLLSFPTASSFTILTSTGTTTDSGITVADTAAIDFGLDVQANTTKLLVNAVSFAPAGSNPNQTAIGNALTAAFNAGGGGLGTLHAGLGKLQTASELAAALDELSPEVVSDAQISALYASLGFSNSLLSCRVNGTTTASIIEEGQCLWVGGNTSFLDRDTTSAQLGASGTTTSFAGGAQFALSEDWRLGLGAGYQTNDLTTSTSAKSDGQLAEAGVALKYNPGPLLLAGTASYGHGWDDTRRPIAITGTAKGSSETDVLSAAMRLAYIFGSPELYLKPVLDASATRFKRGGFTETGGGAANLQVSDSTNTVYRAAPSLEVGATLRPQTGWLARPFLRGGAAWSDGGDFAVKASFVDAPAGVAPFSITAGADKVTGIFGAGIDVVTRNNTALHLSYDLELGKQTTIHSFGLKGSVAF